MTEDEYLKIDSYIATPKQIVSQGEWKTTNNKNQIDTVIQLDDGNEIVASFSFFGSVNSVAVNLDLTWADFKLIYKTSSRQGLWITRIRYNPQKSHTNCLLENFEWSLKTLKKGVCRIYEWEHRKHALKKGLGEERAPAIPLPEIHTFEAFVEYFKNYLNITGEIQTPNVSADLFSFEGGV